MSLRLQIRATERARGHLYGIVNVFDADALVFSDRIKLDLADDRRAFAREVAALHGGLPAERIEAELLRLYGEESARLDEEDADDEAGGDRGTSQATRLVELAAEVELFHAPSGEAYATVLVGNHRETWLVKQRAFKDWLARRYWERYAGTPNSQALADAANVLRGRALFDGPERPVHVRLAELGGAIYLDLADEDWRAVEILPTGWRVIAEPPVKFRRTRGMLALPYPVGGGSLDGLRPFINVSGDDDWRLVVSWLIAALRPSGPYPILTLHGEQGSAKSTAGRVLRALIDPNVAPLRSQPRDERDLMIASTNAWTVTLDNISRIPDWLSDSLCRLATGGGFATRQLYEDAEEMLFDAQRPVILNGIEEVATRGDLLDRSLMVYQPRIPKRKRRAEKTFWRAFDAARPTLLGALLDAVTGAMQRLPDTALGELPRMADFALWAAAAAPSLGWTAEEFLASYRASAGSVNELPLEASALGDLIRSLVELGPWEGTATELLAALNEAADLPTRKLRGWPKDAARLSGELRRLAPSFRESGVSIRFIRDHDGRRIAIARGVDDEPEPDPTSGRRAPASEQPGETASPASPASREPESGLLHEGNGAGSRDAVPPRAPSPAALATVTATGDGPGTPRDAAPTGQSVTPATNGNGPGDARDARDAVFHDSSASSFR